jgi:hypothetical protein
MATYQLHLDRVSDAIWRRDHEAVADEMRYPHVISAGQKVREIADRAAYLLVLVVFGAALSALRATDYYRVASKARVDPETPDRIDGTHRVFILRGGSYVIEPYRADLVLHRVDGVWLGGDLTVHVDRRDDAASDPIRHIFDPI